MYRSTLVLCFLGAVLLSTGCGGSGGGGSTRRLSEITFRLRANHICSKLSREAKADTDPNSKSGVKRGFARIDAALNDLGRLNPPAQDEKRYRTLLTSFRRSVDFLKTNRPQLVRMAKRLQSHPSDKRTEAQYKQLLRTFEQDIALARLDSTALGLNRCASGFSSGSG